MTRREALACAAVYALVFVVLPALLIFPARVLEGLPVIAIRNPHAVSRIAHRQLSVGVAEHEPAHLLDAPATLTLEEQVNDALISLENRDRYLAQSVATVVGGPAPIPPRPSLRLISASSPGSLSLPSPEGASGELAPFTDKE